jgi:hypothetical protein
VKAEACSEVIIEKVPGADRPWQIGCHFFRSSFVEYPGNEAKVCSWSAGSDREVVDAIAARKDSRGSDIRESQSNRDLCDWLVVRI